jgi:hypothetical protein
MRRSSVISSTTRDLTERDADHGSFITGTGTGSFDSQRSYVRRRRRGSVFAPQVELAASMTDIGFSLPVQLIDTKITFVHPQFPPLSGGLAQFENYMGRFKGQNIRQPGLIDVSIGRAFRVSVSSSRQQTDCGHTGR